MIRHKITWFKSIMCHFNTWLLGTIYCYLLLLPQKKINKCLFIYLILYSLNIFAIEMSHWRMFTTANLLVWIPMESTVVQFWKLMTSIRLFFPPHLWDWANTTLSCANTIKGKNVSAAPNRTTLFLTAASSFSSLHQTPVTHHWAQGL